MRWQQIDFVKKSWHGINAAAHTESDTALRGEDKTKATYYTQPIGRKIWN